LHAVEQDIQIDVHRAEDVVQIHIQNAALRSQHTVDVVQRILYVLIQMDVVHLIDPIHALEMVN
jgi:hypothetical protein